MTDYQRATLAQRADEYRRAQSELIEARDELAAETRAALEAGVSQSECSRIVGVDRLTIRKWMTP